jgi:hypothetical protein
VLGTDDFGVVFVLGGEVFLSLRWRDVPDAGKED